MTDKTEYHFVITLQSDEGEIVTQDGTVPLAPGECTRMALFTDLKRQVAAGFGITGPVIVLFFSFEPNTLATH